MIYAGFLFWCQTISTCDGWVRPLVSVVTAPGGLVRRNSALQRSGGAGWGTRPPQGQRCNASAIRRPVTEMKATRRSESGARGNSGATQANQWCFGSSAGQFRLWSWLLPTPRFWLHTRAWEIQDPGAFKGSNPANCAGSCIQEDRMTWRPANYDDYSGTRVAVARSQHGRVAFSSRKSHPQESTRGHVYSGSALVRSTA